MVVAVVGGLLTVDCCGRSGFHTGGAKGKLNMVEGFKGLRC